MNKPKFSEITKKILVVIRHIFLLPVYFYRKCISPFTPPHCRFTPTCSQYAVQAVLTHGIFKGVFLAFKRILRCNPFCDGGYDPVPPKKEKLKKLKPKGNRNSNGSENS